LSEVTIRQIEISRFDAAQVDATKIAAAKITVFAGRGTTIEIVDAAFAQQQGRLICGAYGRS
jgi:hypothetical protein